MPEGSRQRLLFVSPVMPATGGNGLAMRAGNLVEALSESWDVFVAVLAVGGIAGQTLEPALAAHAADCRELPYGEMLDPAYAAAAQLPPGAAQLAAADALDRPREVAYRRDAAADALRALYPDIRFDTVFVLRQYMAPVAARFLDDPDRPAALLDMDDDDVEARRRFATVLRSYDESDDAALEELAARQYAAWEQAWLPRFDMAFAASPTDVGRIMDRNPDALIDVLPNVVRPVTAPVPAPREREGGSILMVGNLGYLPNIDGALFLGQKVACLLPDTARIVIAGSRPPENVRALSARPGVSVVADPPDVSPLYRDAVLAAVPLRAGGGTRIKILEAFAHGVPVVSTTLGAEGLDVEHGRHLLIADTPRQFAEACHDLMVDSLLRERLVETARALQAEAYSLESLRRRFSGPG